MSTPTPSVSDAVALGKLQIQLQYVITGIDELKVSIKQDIPDIHRRLTALELDKVQREAKMSATLSTGKAFWAGMVVIGGIAWTAIQAVAHKLGWF